MRGRGRTRSRTRNSMALDAKKVAVPEDTAKFREETSCSRGEPRAALHNLGLGGRFGKRLSSAGPDLFPRVLR